MPPRLLWMSASCCLCCCCFALPLPFKILFGAALSSDGLALSFVLLPFLPQACWTPLTWILCPQGCLIFFPAALPPAGLLDPAYLDTLRDVNGSTYLQAATAGGAEREPPG